MNPVDIFTSISDWITSVVFYSVDIGDTSLPLIVVWLVVAGAFFTVWLGFMQVRGPKLAINLVRGKYSDPDDAGEVSHFQALATAVSGTVGLGNIAGVAVAISLGGPGATFWMILAGLLGMATKMAECTLGVKYRTYREDGSVSGGPMYYLRDGLAERGMGGLGKVLAVAFSICMIGGAVGGGNMFQSNQATAQIISVTGGDDSFFADAPWILGIVFAVAVGAVIIGGIKSIAKVTEKIVPFMAGLYLISCAIVILANIGSVPGAIGDIFAGAFTGAGVTGGVIGALIVGFQRAAFSNEAGLGSASVAHSAVKTKEPATEGFVAMLEPFIDTVVVCTATALTIVITKTYADPDASELGGVDLTSRSFETVLPWFPIVLAIAVVLFAFSTMISWSYYGMKATGYLFGNNVLAENIFKGVFLVFTVVGSAAALGPVINFSDSMIFLMGIPNIIGLYLLARVIRREIHSYYERVNSGEVKEYAHR
ncbi:MAG: alanine/glycine:cation symporter family protein [Ornithinibacter sp.]